MDVSACLCVCVCVYVCLCESMLIILSVAPKPSILTPYLDNSDNKKQHQKGGVKNQILALPPPLSIF
uniref:Putative secreted protein n=1 Tax=Anopheles darlingi TaxID=43151 RepID=A0A2M4D3E2_ANODA